MDGQARLGLFGVEWLNMNACRRFRTYACKLLCNERRCSHGDGCSHVLIVAAGCWTTAPSDEGTEVSRHPFSLRPQGGSLTTLTGHPEAA